MGKTTTLTEQHDGGGHDGAKLAAQLVSKKADEELAGNDTRHLGVGQRVGQLCNGGRQAGRQSSILHSLYRTSVRHIQMRASAT